MDGTDGEATATSPAAAFSLLGNDQRMAILEALWEERDPMGFSTLREAVGIADSGQFNYHLGKLLGLYVRETDRGYQLTRPGRRVLTAVLAGDLLDRPAVEPTRVDWPCPRCGADVTLRYDDEMLRVLCTACPGFFQGEAQSKRERRENPTGTISVLPIPPAGIEGRGPRELLAAAFVWLWYRDTMAASGMCPECSGDIDVEVLVCPDHEPGEGLCDACGSRFGAIADMTCEVCGDGLTSLMGATALADPRVLQYFFDHGFDLTTADPAAVRATVSYDEVVLDGDPPGYEFRWTFDGETLAVRLADALDVVHFERNPV
jgi:hypothetical protein